MEGNEAREVEAILEVVSKKIPGVFSALRDVVYSQEAAHDLGRSAATFFRELKEGGMNEEQAFELTRDYLASIKNMGNMNLRNEKNQEDR